MQALVQGIRLAQRRLRRTPGFTLVALGVIALGIATTTIMFGFAHAYLLERLPFEGVDRLVALQQLDRESGGAYSVVYANFLDWRERTATLEDLALYHDTTAKLRGESSSEKLKVMHATGILFPALGVHPAMGRLLNPQDDQPQAPMTAVLSYGLWQRRFASDPEVVGRTIDIDGRATIVVGVLSQDFAFPPWSTDQAEIWLPLEPWIETGNQWFRYRGASGSTGAVGRLKPGVSVSQARADMDTVARQLEAQYPETNEGRGVFVAGLQEYMVRNVRSPVMLLAGAVAFVLLILCANLANLMLVRSIAHARSFSIQRALGASRWAIVGQVVSESALLATVGGAVGGVLAIWGGRVVSATLPGHLRPGGPLVMNAECLLFFVGTMVVTALAASLAPVIQALRSHRDTLAATQERTAIGQPATRLRDTLVVGELAAALVLLAGAGLMVNSMARYLYTDPGFDPDGVVSLRISTAYEADQRREMYEELRREVAAFPGVASVGVSSTVLGVEHSTTGSYGVRREGRTGVEDSYARFFEVTPGFFRAMRMRLLAGRLFTDRDLAGPSNAVIVDDLLARKWWSDRNPIGQRVWVPNGDGAVELEVVGVVSRVMHEGADIETPEALYYPAYRWWGFDHDRSLVVRGRADPVGLVASIRDLTTQLDPAAAIYEVRTLPDILAEQSWTRRVSAAVLAAFALAALFLAGLGIYGVMAFAVQRRTPEVGVRMALGADASDILKLILSRGATLALFGVGLGLLGTLALGRLAESLLYEVTPTDPPTLLAAVGVAAGAALLASYLPARRASRTDPIKALRQE